MCIIRRSTRFRKDKSCKTNTWKAINETSKFFNIIEAELIKKAIEQINELYKIKQNRDANSIEYSSLERLKELFEVEKNRERE